MKLQHLPIGARFEYEGKVYVKTGPLTAASEEGGSRIIPRSAGLKAVGGAVPVAESCAGQALDRATVLAAFGEFNDACASLVDAASQEKLLLARKRFLEAIGG